MSDPKTPLIGHIGEWRTTADGRTSRRSVSIPNLEADQLRSQLAAMTERTEKAEAKSAQLYRDCCDGEDHHMEHHAHESALFARNAALREALEATRKCICELIVCGVIAEQGDVQAELDLADNALSTSAGSALLERVRVLEAELEHAKDLLHAEYCGGANSPHNFPCLRRKALEGK